MRTSIDAWGCKDVADVIALWLHSIEAHGFCNVALECGCDGTIPCGSDPSSCIAAWRGHCDKCGTDYFYPEKTTGKCPECGDDE